MFKIIFGKDIIEQQKRKYVRAIELREKALRERNNRIKLLKRENDTLRMTLENLDEYFAKRASPLPLERNSDTPASFCECKSPVPYEKTLYRICLVCSMPMHP